MKFLLRFALSPIGRRLGAIAAIVIATGLTLLAIFNAGVDHGRKPVALDRDRWRTTAGQYLAAAKAWEGSFREDAKIRGVERGEAIAAVNAVGKACDARVAAARRSAVAIQSIVTKETTYDQAHCPVRAVVGAAQLSDALGVTAAGR